MQLSTTTIVLLAAAVALGFGTLPAALHYWRGLAQEVSERAAFARVDAAEMARKYPSFMGSIVELNARKVAEGALWPVLMRAWDTNTLVCAVRAIVHWVATNFLVRVLSPQTIYDCIGLGALLLLLIAAIYVGGIVYANIMMARTFRRNVKLASRTASAPVDACLSDE